MGWYGIGWDGWHNGNKDFSFVVQDLVRSELNSAYVDVKHAC